MPLSAALLLVLAAGDVHVAAVSFKAVSVDAQKAEFLTNYFSDQLGKSGHFAVTTPAQVAAIIGQEREKQLLGCSEAQASCLAEIAGAIGSDAIVTGSIARIGVRYAVEVKITKSTDASQIVSASETLSREEDLLPWLHDRAEEFAPKVRRALGAAVTEARPLRSKAFIPYIIGGVLIGGAGVSYSLAQNTHQELVSPDSSYATQEDARNAVSRGETYNAITVGAAIAGGVALAVGTAFVLWPSNEEQVSLYVAPGVNALSFGGRF